MLGINLAYLGVHDSVAFGEPVLVAVGQFSSKLGRKGGSWDVQKQLQLNKTDLIGEKKHFYFLLILPAECSQ